MLREFSIPLIAGVILALVWVNASPAGYHSFDHDPLIFGLSFHFITNDLFMVFFFGIAAAEITQSCLPGGDLHPLRKAINPLLATAGGVLGPVSIYLVLNRILGHADLARGWGIPTATDIALAWFIARLVFGNKHPAISFLLLLAIADDAVGLIIIAVFYPDPAVPVEPMWLLLTGAAMASAYLLKRANIRNYWPYLLISGATSWAGLFLAHLHPALALAFIIPFLPHAQREHKHVFEEDTRDVSPLAAFEHEWKVVVDFGLFLFGLANGGVELASMGTATWLVLAALLFGKTGGIALFSLAGKTLGYPPPAKIGAKELALVGLIAGIGLTVSLFIAGEAFTEPQVQGAAKMGALLSISFGGMAVALGRLMRLKRLE